MKKAQKLTALALSCALAAACAMPAMADENVINQNSPDKTAVTTVAYQQNSSYTVTIPQLITLNSAEAVEGTVSASAVNLVPNVTLKVSLAADTAVLSRENDANTKLTSVITFENGESLSDGYEVLSTNENVDQSVKLKFSALSAGEGQTTIRAGEYKGTITFTVTVTGATE